MASKLAHDLQFVPGVVDSHVFQMPDAPRWILISTVRLATELGIDQQKIASNVLVDDQFQRPDNA